MNVKDRERLTHYWHKETSNLNEKIDDAMRQAQDHAYDLGLTRGLGDRPKVDDLLSLLVAITHHPGALEELRCRWEPLVQAKLNETAGITPGPKTTQTDTPPSKRWNFEATAEAVMVCKDEHPKGAPCEYEPLTPAETLELIETWRSLALRRIPQPYGQGECT